MLSYYDGLLAVDGLIKYLRTHNLGYDGADLRRAAGTGGVPGLGHTVTFDSKNTASVPVILNKIIGGKATPVSG